jgi:TrkA domain protein
VGSDVHVEELFGIGKRYDLGDPRTRRISVVVHKDGARELYLFDSDLEEPVATVRLTEEEARKVGAILGGTFFGEGD